MEYNELVKSELAQMEQRLTEMEEKIDNIDKKLNQVVDAILGNSLTKSGGFMQEMEKIREKIYLLERKQDKMDDFKKRIVWTIGIIVAAAMVIQYIIKVYSEIK
jgi:division protein CdvB (Snf7/Vps24/ESCRT-III family)